MVRVTFAIPPLLMVVDPWDDPAQTLDRLDDIGAIEGVLLDQSALILRKRLYFRQDGFRDRQLAYIV